MFALETTLKVKGMFNICFVQKTNFYSYYVLFKASWIINVNHVEKVLKVKVPEAGAGRRASIS